jgi:hypothetical protein
LSTGFAGVLLVDWLGTGDEVACGLSADAEADGTAGPALGEVAALGAAAASRATASGVNGWTAFAVRPSPTIDSASIPTPIAANAPRNHAAKLASNRRSTATTGQL